MGAPSMDDILEAESAASARYGNFYVPHIVDETLREGVERCMFPVSTDQLMVLFHHLVDAGLREFVVGSGPEEPELYRRICEERDREEIPTDVIPILLVLLNCWDATYGHVRRMRTEWISNTTFSFGMIPHRRNEKLFETVVARFKDLGARHLKVSILNDFTRQVDQQQYDEIRAQIDWARELGIRTIRVNDSLGRLYPESTERLCSHLVQDYPDLVFCLHCHNDRGLALANQLVSIYNGFQMVEGSLCGHGNRSGIAAIEILIAVCLEKNIGLGDRPLDIRRLCQAAQLAEQIFMQIPNVFRPISGQFVNKANFGVLNIPDFLDAEGERDYFLNVVNLHPNTIRRALEAHGFEPLLEDERFLTSVAASLRETIEGRYTKQLQDYHRVMSEILEFYRGALLSNADMVKLAGRIAREHPTAAASSV